jgi:hypothetical protein
MTMEIRMVFVGFCVWGVVRLAVYYCVSVVSATDLEFLRQSFALGCTCGGS